MRSHWKTYGRNYYLRYDYEQVGALWLHNDSQRLRGRPTASCATQVDAAKANHMFEHLLAYGSEFTSQGYGPDKPKVCNTATSPDHWHSFMFFLPLETLPTPAT